MSKHHKKPPAEPFIAHVESLSHDGRGVARIDGKTVFIQGALPGETLWFVYTACHRGYDEGRVKEIVVPAAERVSPRCVHFGVCGGCSLQHMEASAQIQAKQHILVDNLIRIGKVPPPALLPPLTGPVWGYRRKARLGVHYVPEKHRVLIGFRKRQSRRLADLTHCEVLLPQVGERLSELGELIAGLSCRDQITQIEVAAGEGATALVLRHLVPLVEADRTTLIRFGEQTGLHLWLQSGGPDTAMPLYPADSALSYRLAHYGLELAFRPGDFTQVNGELNPSMIEQALTLLAVGPGDRVLDLFCGMGNFSLPLARRAGAVIGVEGEAGLVARARANAERNALHNVEFHIANLTDTLAGCPWLRGQRYTHILLDPPRTGADRLLPQLCTTRARRIVYVSCHPGTLARDAGILVHSLGYRLLQVGVMDMFPHTAHVESIALFERV